jgi:peroxiredoxin
MRDAPFFVSYGVLWVIVVFQGLLLLGVTRAMYARGQDATTSSANEDVDGLERGTPLPDFTVRDVEGGLIQAGDFRGRTSAILFVSPTCPTCSVTLEELGALQSKTDENVVVVCRAATPDCQQLIDHYELSTPLIAGDDAYSLSSLLRIAAVPTAVLIDADGAIDSYGAPKRGEELERLFRGKVTSEEVHA